MSKQSPFVLDKAIRSAVVSVKTVRQLRNDDFLLEVASAVHNRIVNKMGNLAGGHITTSPHRTLSTSKGVIRCALLVDCGKEETLRELKSQGVKHIQSNLIISNSDNSNLRLYRGRNLVPAVSHYKRREKASDLSNTGISNFPLYRASSAARKYPRPSFISNNPKSVVGRPVKCDTCRQYQAVNTP